MMPFGLQIAIINRAFRKEMDEKAGKMGLTSVQLRVLWAISRLEMSGETEIHQRDLEKIEHVTHPAMTKLLRRLEDKGFIRCVSSQRDRRYKKIACTERSAGIYEMLLEQDAQVWTRLCAGFTQQEQEHLQMMLGAILKRIDAAL